MLTCIPSVLEEQELDQIDALIKGAEFEDGKLTAGARASKVKYNEQLKSDATQKNDLHRLIDQALTRNELFQHVAIPKSIRPPLFSRYVPGMEYGPHVDDSIDGWSN